MSAKCTTDSTAKQTEFLIFYFYFTKICYFYISFFKIFTNQYLLYDFWRNHVKDHDTIFKLAKELIDLFYMEEFPREDIWKGSLVVVQIYLALSSVFVNSLEKLTEQHLSDALDLTYKLRTRLIQGRTDRKSVELEFQVRVLCKHQMMLDRFNRHRIYI